MKWFHHCLLLTLLAAVGFGGFHEVRSKLQAADGDVERLRLTEAAGLTQPGQAGNPFSNFGNDEKRQQLLERTKTKIELMSSQEVDQALQSTDSEIRTMQAKKQLDQTAETLRSIVANFDGTPSAQLAQEMLGVHERGLVPTRDPSPTRVSPIEGSFQRPPPTRDELIQ